MIFLAGSLQSRPNFPGPRSSCLYASLQVYQQTIALTPEFIPPFLQLRLREWRFISKCLFNAITHWLRLVNNLNSRVHQVSDSQRCLSFSSRSSVTLINWLFPWSIRCSILVSVSSWLSFLLLSLVCNRNRLWSSNLGILNLIWFRACTAAHIMLII